ncbi:MAG: ATP-dependent helicase [Sporomusaceae bacterium]|nr:ATP-dependent helicase [Sporomusaceae bacterium]
MIITAKTEIDIGREFKVEAGPGAGKTEFLVNHIKRVLQNAHNLDSTRKVACITYTNTAVEIILKRLGKSVSNRVEVSTIHSFLYRNVVKPYCSFISEEYKLCCSKVKGHDEFSINNNYIRDWFENEDFSGLKHPNTQNQLLSLPALNKALQNWLLSNKCIIDQDNVSFICDNTKAIGYDKKSKKYIGINIRNLNILSGKLLELKKIYWQKGKLDHNDVLFFSYILIKKYPFIITVLSAKFAYLFVDEYQDTNPIQSFVIDEIRKKNQSIVGVIGDRAQSIYNFQGAEPSLFTAFKANRDNLYTIVENHRSSNQIVKFLNGIRSDIEQKPCENIDDIEVVVYVGNKNMAYREVCETCAVETVVSLSRDNITSNAMKREMEETHLNKKLVEEYMEQDSNGERKRYILAFIQAIELANNSKYKDAIKNIVWIFRDESQPKKNALYSLVKMLKVYKNYCDGTLMNFYNLICTTLNANLSGFRNGAAKTFYDTTSYKNLAVCVNIIEDTSNHITIHKSKGAEYQNVLVIGNEKLEELLIKPDLLNNEEHRILYVAMSRAKEKLFLQLDSLSVDGEKRLLNKYNYLDVKRLETL